MTRRIAHFIALIWDQGFQNLTFDQKQTIAGLGLSVAMLIWQEIKTLEEQETKPKKKYRQQSCLTFYSVNNPNKPSNTDTSAEVGVRTHLERSDGPLTGYEKELLRELLKKQREYEKSQLIRR